MALLLNLLPTAAWPILPDWLALVLVFWSVREPRRVGMGLAFLGGIAMDVANAGLLGQHALAYVLAVYGGGALSRRSSGFHSRSRRCTSCRCCCWCRWCRWSCG